MYLVPKRAGPMSSAISLVRIGLDRVIALARSGSLPPAYLWAALKGGFRYLEAIANGDVSPEAVAAERLAKCQSCNALEIVDTSKAGIAAGYCGRGEPIAGGPTCGCLVAISISGEPIKPAGKALVGSEVCPRFLWLPYRGG